MPEPALDIRYAVAADTPQIIDLFRICLRDAGGSPTDAFWQWKHQLNPFGPSPVLLAFHQDQLVGMRAFLRWNWQYAHKVYPAFRAVDTATHPQWQGRGIFRKLTMLLWQQLQQEHPAAFVYNTPNHQSKPGYLKMGWQVLGKPRARFVYRPGLGGSRKWKLAAAEQLLQTMDVRQLNPQVFNQADPALISPHQSATYFHWRYQLTPDRTYAAWVFDDGAGGSCLLVFYLRKRRVFTELRICDRLVLRPGAAPHTLKSRSMQAIAREFPGCVVTSLCYPDEPASPVLERFVPEITLRMPDRRDALPACWTDISQWNLDMGTLELF